MWETDGQNKGGWSLREWSKWPNGSWPRRQNSAGLNYMFTSAHMLLLFLTYYTASRPFTWLRTGIVPLTRRCSLPSSVCYIFYMYNYSCRIELRHIIGVHSQREDTDHNWSLQLCIYSIYEALSPPVWPAVSNDDIQTYIHVDMNFVTLQSIILKCKTQFIFSKWFQGKILNELVYASSRYFLFLWIIYSWKLGIRFLSWDMIDIYHYISFRCTT